MSAQENGGPAFPSHGSMGEVTYEGISVLDYFAAKAMQAEIITSTSDATPESADALIDAAGLTGRTLAEQLAFNAYVWAAAMLAARRQS